ncbi:DUF7489 domain-containing protein [Streptomyces monashensis]|uniref:DUF7489 domain-containing protein n=1 Tax=Streptomyces monashensis TaxID=1678012 RepID=A0A1S2PNT5_9ACTN|nr:hypothetical protein [Streptomyces monashensis]OIJ95180.1 hypothetical protein BIV23_35370 [Streptomyces monashensis]
MFKSRKVHEEDAWDGIVIDKTRKAPDGSNLYHYVEVRLQDSTTKKARIDKVLWESLAIGDRLVKEAGTATPAKAHP